MFGTKFEPRTESAPRWIEKQRFFRLGTPPALRMAAGPMGASLEMQRGSTMFSSFSSARQTATVFAGAFVTALLLVSAATSLPIA
jgi:hypothetical protein